MILSQQIIYAATVVSVLGFAFTRPTVCTAQDAHPELVDTSAYTLGQSEENDEYDEILTASPVDVFWNTHSGRFIYPPAFDFHERDGASGYRFTVTSLSDGSKHEFVATSPAASLAPVWSAVNPDSLLLTVEAFLHNGNVVPVAERRFIKSPGFVYPVDAHSPDYYREAGIRSLDSLFRSPRVQHWLESGRPNPDYPLWVYPSKVMGATTRAMAHYSAFADADGDSEPAVEAAAAAVLIADFMLDLREPEGSPLAGWPPVHWRGVEPENHPVYEGEYMVQFPAEAGWALLDLYDLTSDAKYLNAVINIADRYVATQREDGTWYLLLMAETGEPGRRKNPVVPTYMIELFDRLHVDYGMDGYLDARRDAFDWIMQNPVATFAWEAQFEDTRPKPSLQNLAYREAAHVAKLIFGDPSTVEMAELILRFVEDQFVVWDPSDPILYRNWFSARNSQWNGNDPRMGKDWFLPAVLEQYAFYTPIAGAAATVMDVYVTAFQTTGKPAYHAKAVAIANAIVAAQSFHGDGEIPTHMRRSLPEKNWSNVGVHSALKLIEHADVLGTEPGH